MLVLYCLCLSSMCLCYYDSTMWESTITRPRKGLWITVCAVILVLIGLGTVWYVTSRQQSPFPASMQDSKLTKFYPTTLPDGFAVDKSSMKQTSGVITYIATDAKKRYINFSLQPRAESFDFNTFYGTILTRSFKFVTSNGEAAVGTMQSNGNSVGSLVNSSTWVIVSATASVSNDDIQKIVSGLKPY